LIHRDVSLQNILLSYDGSVKLIDFGIAKAANKINQTQAGILKGKFSYMSPEQAKGQKIDHRVDLFALGIVLYELLTLERCFFGESDFSTIERVRNVDYVPPRKIRREIPSSLEKILNKALAYDIHRRYQTASDFQDDLDQFLQKEGGQYQKNAQRKSHAQLFMYECFRAEIEKEQLRMDEFYEYARLHIPQARQQKRVPQRFNPQRLMVQKEVEQVSDSRFFFDNRILILSLIALLTILSSLLYVKQQALSDFSSLLISVPLDQKASFELISEENERISGVLPVQIDSIELGHYLLNVKATGYESISMPIHLQSSSAVEVPIQLKQSANFSKVILQSNPLQTQIKINQKAIGQTPQILILEKGNYEIEGTKDQYEPFKKIFSIQKAEEMIQLALLPKNIELTLDAQSKILEFSLYTPGQGWQTLGTGSQKLILQNHGLHQIKVTSSQSRPILINLKRYQSPQVYEKINLIPGNPQQVPLVIDLGNVEKSMSINQISSNTSNAQFSQNQFQEIKSIALPNLSNSLDQLTPTPISTLDLVKVSSNEQAQITLKPTIPKSSTPKSSTPKSSTPKSSTPKSSTPKSSTPKSSTHQSSKTNAIQEDEDQNEESPKSRSKQDMSPQENLQPGMLKLTSKPPAEVFFKGKALGWTPVLYSMPEGVHRVKLKWDDGYPEQEITVVIEAGQETLRKYQRP
jgi:serine/threonine protein kinase